jgi:molybdate transport system permease protein
MIDLSPAWLTFKLATTTTVLLLILGTPLAWWLSHAHGKTKSIIGAIVALPLVLPPTVIGFYLLLFLGPHGLGGKITEGLGLGLLPFTFPGLVVGSLIYSLPFVVQPIQNAFESIGQRPLEVAATLGATPLDRFFSVALPLARPGLITAAVLGFAHTVGEFGVVLLIGGNVTGKTKVISVAIYEEVEALNYVSAHWLSGGLVVFSFLVLLLMYRQRRPLSIGGQ